MTRWTENNRIQEVALMGVLLTIAIVFGMTGFLKMGAGIYLTAVPLFLSPLILRFYWSIIVTIVSVVVVDLITGWIGFAWISIIGYSSGTIIVWFFYSFKKNFIFCLGVIFASIFIVFIYTIMWWIIQKDYAMAIEMMIATSIQMSSVSVITIILFFPIKKIAKKLS